jgi:hypothetical protein
MTVFALPILLFAFLLPLVAVVLLVGAALQPPTQLAASRVLGT